MWRPVRMVLMKSFNVHWPSPVSASGVRLAVKLTPHGPACAVLVADDVISHGPAGSVGAGGITSASGWPDSMRLMSGSGPFGPSLNGVWQSWQPLVLTRYLPRATGVDASAALARGDAVSTVAASVAIAATVQ